MLQKEIEYIRGNTVVSPEKPHMNPDAEREYERLKKAKRDRKLRQKLRKKEIKKSYTQIIIMTFVVGMIVIYGDNRIYKAQSQLNTLKASISAIENENEALKVDILKSSSISDISSAAENKLKMVSPTQNNVVSIDLEKNNFKIVSENSINKNDGILAKIKRLFF